MINKTFKIQSENIKKLVFGMGSCIASDKVTVEGYEIGYMYRETPDFDTDSGWRFFSGTENEEYINNPENLMIYDVNTIANYDPYIIPYLNLNVGTELERKINNSFEVI